LSNETRNLLKKTSLTAENDDSESLGHDDPIIFYCSRTHSQLSQFSAELQRVKLPPIVDEKETSISNTLKHLTLGSRKNLCINPTVLKLRSATAMNEKCVDLQKSGVSERHKCPYLPSKDNEHLVHQFRDLAVAEIRDIEDLGKLGKQLEICPYYASRSAIEIAEVWSSTPMPIRLTHSDRYIAVPADTPKICSGCTWHFAEKPRRNN
jgi:chromosome transmission fidelity protein 1